MRILGAALAGGVLAACDQSPQNGGESGDRGAPNRSPPAPPKPPTQAELAILAPLTKGSPLGGWEVSRIEGIDRGALRVVCVKDRAVVRLYVALSVDGGPAPPATAGQYSVFYSLKDATPEDGERLAKELAAVVEKNSGAPPPPGIAPFVPRPAEPISL
jgi:hypothetical protein